MIFSSIFFVFAYLPIVLILYYLVPFKFKNLVLLLVSLVFYAWGEPVYVVLMLFSIAINFVSGLELEYFIDRGEMRKAKYACIVTAAINLGVLGFYKYYGFVIENLNAILPFDIPYTKACAADRDLFLHIPDDVLCDRRLPRKSKGNSTIRSHSAHMCLCSRS